MTVLKILLWIILIILILVVLAVLMVLLALSVKIQLGFDYDKAGIKFRLKYGFFGLKIYPELFTPEKMERYKGMFEKVKGFAGPWVNKFANKAKDKAAEKKEMGDIKSELKNAEEFEKEEARIASETARVEAELIQADADLESAIRAEEAGNPFPDGVDEKEVSKLEGIKQSLETVDFEGAYHKVKGFMSGFSFNSIMALLSYFGSQTGRTMGKVVSRVKIKQFFVGLTISGDDAAKTALKYGRISAIAFPAMGKMVTSLNVQDYDLELSPDFLAKKDSGELHTIIAFRPLFLLTPFVGYIFKVGKGSFSFYRTYKKTAKAKKAENKSAK